MVVRAQLDMRVYHEGFVVCPCITKPKIVSHISCVEEGAMEGLHRA
jgi:hypothetical protein